MAVVLLALRRARGAAMAQINNESKQQDAHAYGCCLSEHAWVWRQVACLAMAINIYDAVIAWITALQRWWKRRRWSGWCWLCGRVRNRAAEAHAKNNACVRASMFVVYTICCWYRRLLLAHDCVSDCLLEGTCMVVVNVCKKDTTFLRSTSWKRRALNRCRVKGTSAIGTSWWRGTAIRNEKRLTTCEREREREGGRERERERNNSNTFPFSLSLFKRSSGQNFPETASPALETYWEGELLPIWQINMPKHNDVNKIYIKGVTWTTLLAMVTWLDVLLLTRLQRIFYFQLLCTN